MREISTEHARSVLTAEGFVVEDIPVEPPAKRADLRLRFGEEEYVLEAKLRGPHGSWRQLLVKVRAEGSASTSRRIEPWSALSSMITEAHDQLAATPARADAIRVLWAVALDDDENFVVACLEKRLVGTESLVAVARDDLYNVKMLECYHYASNDFERCPDIDAAVVGTSKGGKLFVNYFSHRREHLRRSHLYGMFAARNAVIDPELLAAQGEALMLGSGFIGPRGDGAQWEYLKERHGVCTSVSMDAQFDGILSIPRESLSRQPFDQ
jgi:hypothetical protein